MRKDLDSLKRRPFLFPLLMPVAMLALLLVIAVWVFDARATTIVILAPPAEVENNTDPDPNLSLTGKERAARLARMLSQLQLPRAVDAVFAADTRRAQQTVQPLAEALALPVNVLTNSAWSDIASRIRGEHRGEVVLVCGDVKSLPPLLGDLVDSETSAPTTSGSFAIAFVPRLSRSRVLQLTY